MRWSCSFFSHLNGHHFGVFSNCSCFPNKILVALQKVNRSEFLLERDSFAKLFIKHLNKIIKIVKNCNFIEIIFLVLRKIKLIRYNSFVEKRKLQLEQEVILLTKKKVINGFYKGIQLNCKSNWGTGDYSSKLLGRV